MFAWLRSTFGGSDATTSSGGLTAVPPGLLALLASQPFPRVPQLMAPSDADVAAGPVVVASVAAFGAKPIEAAGFAYQTMLRARAVAARGGSGAGASGSGRARGGAGAPAVGGAGSAGAADDDGLDTPESEEFCAEEKRRLTMAMGSDNHYEMLGLGHLNINASDEQIKRAHRRLVLRYHPDKQAGAESGAAATKKGGEATDPLFLAIQKAYDVLSNDKTRRGYDSQYEFDDAIPSGSEDLGADNARFFELYRPVFERNARWSSRKPVPGLGKPDDSDERVRAFYAFWFEFDSWRDFSGEGEHNAEEAESREERRWMERENEKVAAKSRRLEVARLNNLVTRAYARDPRVIAMKKAEEDEKKAAREAKAAAKRAAEDEARRREEEKAAAEKAAAEAAKAEAAARKAERERERKAAKRSRAELRRQVEAAIPWLAAHGGAAAAAAEAHEAGKGGKRRHGVVAVGDGGSADAAPYASVEAALLAVEYLAEEGRASLEELGAVIAAFPAGLTPASASSSAAATPTTPSTPAAGGAGGPSEAAAGGSFSFSSSAVPAPSAPLTPAACLDALRALKAFEEAAREREREAKEAAAAEAKAKADAAAGGSGSGAASGAAGGGAGGARPEWSVQEAGMLAKAVAKFPPGTKQRWECIATHVNGLNLGHARTPDECIAKSRALTASEEEKRRANLNSYSVFLAARGSAAEGAVVDKDAAAKPAAAAAVTVVAAGAAPAPAAAAAAPVSGIAAAKAAVAATAAPAGGASPAAKPAGKAAAAAAPAAAPGAVAVVVDAATGGWSAEQQSAFEKALRDFPASLDKAERWKKIAEAVPGKSKADCIARFKEIRERVMAAKGGAAAT